MRRVFLSFSEDASMPPMSVQRLGEAITHGIPAPQHLGQRRDSQRV